MLSVFFTFSCFKLSGTCQDLLYRRARALVDYENSNKSLDKARLKSRDIPQAEEHQKQCLQKFDKLSESGKKGLCVRALEMHSVLASLCVKWCALCSPFLTGHFYPHRTHQFQGQACCGLQEEPHRDGRAGD